MIRLLIALALLTTASAVAAEPLKVINGRLFIPANAHVAASTSSRPVLEGW